MTLIAFIVICVIGYNLYKIHVNTNLGSLKSNVELKWNKYVENLKERNAELSKQIYKDDSLRYYLESKGKFIRLSECSEELEFNEYKINQFVITDGIKFDINDKINSTLDLYNQAVKEYNEYRIIFPNSLMSRKTKFRRYYNYFDIRYGINNKKMMIKKIKVENWIKNGGPYPE